MGKLAVCFQHGGVVKDLDAADLDGGVAAGVIDLADESRRGEAIFLADIEVEPAEIHALAVVLSGESALRAFLPGKAAVWALVIGTLAAALLRDVDVRGILVMGQNAGKLLGNKT